MITIRWWRALLCGLLVAALLFPKPVAAAAPAVPNAGGTLLANTSSDPGTLGDSFLSLREAMNIANGSLLGPFSLA